MLWNGRIVNSAICNIVLASMVLFTGTVEARSGSLGFGHARYASPSGTGRYATASNSPMGTFAPWSRLSTRDAPASQAVRAPATDRRWPSYSSAVNTTPHFASPRGDVSGAESLQTRNDYRQIRTGSRYAPVSYAAPASAPVLLQPAYATNAVAPGYNTNTGNNMLPVAGLLVDAVTAIAERMLGGESYQTDPDDDENDPGYGNDDAR